MIDVDLRSIIIEKGSVNMFKTMLCLEIKFDAESISRIEQIGIDNSNSKFNLGY